MRKTVTQAQDSSAPRHSLTQRARTIATSVPTVSDLNLPLPPLYVVHLHSPRLTSPPAVPLALSPPVQQHSTLACTLRQRPTAHDQTTTARSACPVPRHSPLRLSGAGDRVTAGVVAAAGNVCASSVKVITLKLKLNFEISISKITINLQRFSDVGMVGRRICQPVDG